MQKFRDLVFTLFLVVSKWKKKTKKKRHVLTHVDCDLTRKILRPKCIEFKAWEAEGGHGVISQSQDVH